jgi:predicted nucleic acid-binding protein
MVPDGVFQLVLPEEVVAEVIRVVRFRPYFRQRVTEQEAHDAMAELRRFADVPPPLSEIPSIVRDSADDYLIAYAILERVDFLVTGDRDLLVLDGEIDGLRIVTAADVLMTLDEARADPE